MKRSIIIATLLLATAAFTSSCGIKVRPIMSLGSDQVITIDDIRSGNIYIPKTSKTIKTIKEDKAPKRRKTQEKPMHFA